MEEILLERGWCSREEIDAARRMQSEARAASRRVRLGEALVQRGVLTGEQLREALAVEGKTVMQCPACRRTYNVRTLEPGHRAVCRKCRIPLVLPVSITELYTVDEGIGDVPSVPVGGTIESGLEDVVPGYQLDRRLGSGRKGEVYLARHQVLGSWVAIRLFTPDLAKDPAFAHAFPRGAKSAAKLVHENIVGMIDAGEAGGRSYLVMEYVEGETLEGVLRREKVLPEHRALEIARHVAQGLNFAHEKGLLHNDLKPGSILIASNGKTKISDFGLGHGPIGDPASSPFSYRSPELSRGESRLDYRSDMFSLGVILYEMLTGKHPVSAPTGTTSGDSFPAPRTLDSHISSDSNQIVLRLLQRSREARYRNYGEVLRLLTRAEAAAAKAIPPIPIPPAAPSEPLPSLPEAAVASVPAPPPPVPRASYRAPLWLGYGASAALLLSFYFIIRGGGERIDPEIDSLRREAIALEERAKRDLAALPEARAKWKAFEAKFRGTPHHAVFASPYLEFEAYLAREAEFHAKDLFREADQAVSGNAVVDAILILRSFPSVFSDTPGGGQVSARSAEVYRLLEERYRNGKEVVYTLAASRKFEEARAHLAVVQGVVLSSPKRGAQFLEPRYAQEVNALRTFLEEEDLLSKRRKSETASPERPIEPAPKPPPAPPSALPPAPPTPAPKSQFVPFRSPVPPPQIRKESERIVRELFKREYELRGAGDQQALARRLFELAKQTSDDKAARFVLLSEAQRVASLAGDSALALSAIAALGGVFDVRVTPLKLEALVAASQAAQSPTELRDAVQALLDLSDEAVGEEDFESANTSAKAAAAAARTLKDVSLATRSDTKVREIPNLRTELDAARKARATLAARPEDSDACLVVGRYECLTRNRWEEGLPFLANGSEPSLKALATKDLENSSDPLERVKVGDGWWDLSESESGRSREMVRKRAARIYEQALPSLKGLVKTKIERRLASLSPPPDAAEPAKGSTTVGGSVAEAPRTVSRPPRASEFKPGTLTDEEKGKRHSELAGAARKEQRGAVRAAAARRAAWLEDLEKRLGIYDVTTFVDRGDVSKRVDIVIVSAGFPKAEFRRVNQLADQLKEALLKVDPFRNYPEYINFHRVSVDDASLQTSRIPLRVEANILTCDRRKALEYAQEAPSVDLVVVLCNVKNVRATGGPPVITIDADLDIGRTFLHEMGHAWASLSDEYVDPDLAPAGSFREDEASEWMTNVTAQKNPKLAKWHYWIPDSWPAAHDVHRLPAGHKVGCYEGAAYYAKGAYRSEETCLMRTGDRYCVVCFEHVEKRFYRLISPIDDVRPREWAVGAWIDEMLTFEADALRTSASGGERIGKFEACWYADSKPRTGRSKDLTTTLALLASDLGAGSHEVGVRVDFSNRRVRRDEGWLSSSAGWKVDVVPHRKPAWVGPAAVQGKVGEELTFTVKIENPDPRQFRIDAMDLPEGSTYVDGVFRWTPSKADQGAWRPRLLLTDDLRTVEKAVEIAILDPREKNFDPILSPMDPVSAAEGEVLELPIEASDVDGDNLVFSGSNLPRGAELDVYQGVLRWRPGTRQAGRYKGIAIEVFDGRRKVKGTLEIVVEDNRNARDAKPDLVPLLRAHRPETRRWALGELGDRPRIYQYFEAARLLRDHDSRVRTESLELLGKITQSADDSFRALMIQDLTPHAWHFTDHQEALVWLNQLAGSAGSSSAEARSLKGALRAIDKYNKDRGLP